MGEAVGPASEIGYVTLLSRGEPLERQSLRQALALSLNRNEISQRVSYGLRRPLRSLIPPSLTKDPVPIWPEHDPAAARRKSQKKKGKNKRENIRSGNMRDKKRKGKVKKTYRKGQKKRESKLLKESNEHTI